MVIRDGVVFSVLWPAQMWGVDALGYSNENSSIADF